MVTELESTTNRCRTYHLNPIFAMSTNTTQAYDWVSSFDHLQVDDESAEMTTLGLSPHSISANAALKTDNEVYFPLLSDPDHKVLEAYGAYGEKMLYGKKSVGVIRSTFVVGPDGRIEQAQYAVKATGHVARLRKELGV